MSADQPIARLNVDLGNLPPYHLPPHYSKLCDLFISSSALSDNVSVNSSNPVCRVGVEYIAKIVNSNTFDRDSLRAWIAGQISSLSGRELIGLTNYFFKSTTLVPPLEEATLKRRFVEESYFAHEACNRLLRQKEVARPIPQDILDAIEDVASRQQTNGVSDVTFVFLNHRYIDNLPVWLKLYRTVTKDAHLVIVALDDQTKAAIEADIDIGSATLNALPISAGKLDVCGNGGNDLFLWQIKVELLRSFAKRGISATYSDLDTYWLRDAKRWCNRHVRQTLTDVIFMRSTDMPPISLYEYGFAVNCGFVSCTSTPAAVKFLDEWSNYCALMFDDQIGLYSLLRNSGVRWMSSSDELTEALVFIDGDSIKIGVLSAQMAIRTRNVIQPSGQMLIHPRWAEDGPEHAQWMKNVLDSVAQQSPV